MSPCRNGKEAISISAEDFGINALFDNPGT